MIVQQGQCLASKMCLSLKRFDDDYERKAFDTTSFTELAVVVGNTTWEVMNAKKALKVEWENAKESNIVVSMDGEEVNKQ